jgi:hypothetical protein
MRRGEGTYDEDPCGACGECGECANCFREINRLSDAMHADTEAAWWRDKGSVLLGFSEEKDDATE